jgi:hypothetical protein
MLWYVILQATESIQYTYEYAPVSIYKMFVNIVGTSYEYQ